MADAAPADAIVVTGTRTQRLQRDAPIRTDIVGETVLKYAAPRNLADALEYLPGARAESNCQNCNSTEIQLLGLPGPYNQILFDGLPLLSGVAAVYGVEQIPAVLIDRIEVVKGGASVLYGPGAVAGVVNIIPRPAAGKTGVRAAAGGDLVHGKPVWLLTGAATLARGDSGLTAYAHYENVAPVDLNGDGFTEIARRDLVVAGARGLVALGASATLAFDYAYTDEDRRGGNRLGVPAFLANVAEEIRTQQHRGSLSLSRDFGPDAAVTATYAFALTDRQTFYGGLGDVETDPAAPGFDARALDRAAAISRNQYGATDDDLHYAELRGEAGIGPHALIGGVQYRYERVDDRNVDFDGLPRGQLVRDAFDDIGVFVQDEWSIARNLRLLLGARVDWSSEVDNPIFSPRMGLWWSPVAALVLRANYSTGFRAPEVFSEDLHVDVLGADPIRVRNAPGLVEETSRSWSAGFDWRPAFAGGAFTLDGQAYLTTLSDTFFLGEIETEAGGALFRTRSNAGGSRILGGELTAGWRVSDRLQATLAGAYIRAEFDDAQVVFDDGAVALSTRRYLKTPRWTAVAQLVAEPLAATTAFLALRFVGPMDVLNNRTGRIVGTGSFLVADLSFTRHIAVGGRGGDVDLSVGVKNLFDDRQRDLETGAGRDNDFVYGPRQPRTLFVRLNAAF